MGLWIRSKIVGAKICIIKAIIMMYFKYNLTHSFTSRLLKSHHVIERELAIYTGSNKLTRPNFLDWLRNLRIILKAEKLSYVIDEALPGPLVVDASDEDQRAYK